MPAAALRARLAAGTVFVGVPAVLAGAWLARTPPEELGCGMQTTPARDGVRAVWLDGAGPILALGALAVLAGIVQVSRWRGTTRVRDRGPLRTALLIAAPLTVFVVACGVDTAIFAPAGIAWALLYVFAPLTVPAITLAIGRWVHRQPRGERALAGLQALGWCSLLLGITGVGTMIGGAGIGRIYC